MGRQARAPVRPVTPALLRALREEAGRLHVKYQVPGMAYAIVQEEQTLTTQCLGCLRTNDAGQCPANAPRVNADTVFGIGSITKSFTATQLARLVEEGKLGWEEPVRQHLRGFTLFDPWVTQEFRVSDIASHRSGLPEYCLDLMSLLGFERDAMLRALRHVEPVTSFRGTYAYQNSLLLLAGKLIEQKTGLDWEEALARQLLSPLGMSRSTASPKVLAGWDNVASGHFLLPLEEGQPERAVPMPEDWPYFPLLFTEGPAGALYSSVKDMVRWMRFHLGRGTFDGSTLLGEEGMAFLHCPRIPMFFTLPAVALSYATGWIHTSSAPAPVLWHNGATALGGMSASLGLVPDERTGLVVLTNILSPAADELLSKFAELYLGGPAVAPRVLQDAAPALRPHAPSPRAVRTRGLEVDAVKLCGTFVNPAYGPFRVKQQKDGLVVIMGPLKLTAPLEHLEGLRFQALLPGTPFLLTFQFVLDDKGRAKELWGEDFVDVERGRFLRRD